MVTSTATAIRPAEETAAASRRGALFLLDPLLMVAALGLVACSLVTLHGATHTSSSMDRQAIYAAVGLLVSLVLAVTDYSRLREYKYVLYGTMIVLNVAVLGTSPINGARRWIPLPLFQFQSSEFGKVLLILALGAFVVDRARRLNEIRTTARIMLLAILPALIVIPQPDLGTGMVYVVIGFTVLFVAGTSWKHLAALLAIAAIAVGAVVGGPAFGVHVLKPYQQQRLTGFLNPSHDPSNQTYNITESLIAIGSGEKSGRGTRGATQTDLNYLPAPTTDFVFAALGETYGFVGGALVLSLYALLIWRALRILMMAKNLYGTVIAGGILAMFMFQIFVNVGMTIGIMPITGVPLPLMSYGGSSVLVTFIAVGLLQSIYVQGRKASMGKNRGLIG